MGVTLAIELTDEEEARVRAKADAQGKPVQEFLRGLIEQAAPDEEPAPQATPAPKSGSLAELFEQWRRDDYTEDPEELQRAQEELDALKARLNANRAATGERPLFA
jgi:hypothetical protein